MNVHELRDKGRFTEGSRGEREFSRWCSDSDKSRYICTNISSNDLHWFVSPIPITKCALTYSSASLLTLNFIQSHIFVSEYTSSMWRTQGNHSIRSVRPTSPTRCRNQSFYCTTSAGAAWQQPQVRKRGGSRILRFGRCDSDSGVSSGGIGTWGAGEAMMWLVVVGRSSRGVDWFWRGRVGDNAAMRS